LVTSESEIPARGVIFTEQLLCMGGKGESGGFLRPELKKRTNIIHQNKKAGESVGGEYDKKDRRVVVTHSPEETRGFLKRWEKGGEHDRTTHY